MNQKKKYKPGNPVRRLCVFAAVLCLLVTAGTAAYAEEPNGTTVQKLQNGSFEEGGPWTSTSHQPNQSAVPSWNTTAFEGKIELFKENTGTYITGVTLKPTAGSIAAELNADEESTLYQVVSTPPSSIYEWGLDHGARNGTDTMALIIGPKQSVNPSKPSKTGRDQLMQMVDWLIRQGKTSVKTSAGLGEQLTVYSKKFADNGTFEDNAGNNAFSLTPSAIYTEEWHIWIMASSRATSGTNPWNSYGSNAEGSANIADRYYLYTVPAGQTETLFAFVSVGCMDSNAQPIADKTLGNFLDNINFEIYHPLSGSTTNHGSAVICTTEEGNSPTEHQVSVQNKLDKTYVKEGTHLEIQAIINGDDVNKGCEFVGVYYTTLDTNGTPVTEFLQLAGHEIADTGVLTEEQKRDNWVKSTDADGNVFYTRLMADITSATDLHFIFIKSPTITYDPNGGKDFVVERTYNTDEAANVYSFKPVAVDTDLTFIPPYVSKAAEGQNDGWKFMGWLLTGDTVDNVPSDKQVNADRLGSLLLPAVHTIACDYSESGTSTVNTARYFKIYNGAVSLTERRTAEGVTWTDNGEEKAYANVHRGLTLVAQWRWQQAFIPQTGSGTTYTDSDAGGTVKITSVTDTSDTNYNAAYNTNGGKSYHAATDEKITVEATPKTGFTFEGWYDASGNLLTTKTTYSYTETKESVNTCYARFTGTVTQTYLRQVKNSDTWEITTDDSIGTLGLYTHTDVTGTVVNSTATAGTGYKFVGWYDSDGNKVPDDMLISEGGKTISYTTTGDATYYARFAPTVTQTYIRQVKNGDTWADTTDNSIGTLNRYTHTDVTGKAVSSTATAGTGYKFVGWYDSTGNAVTDTMLTPNGTTIHYITTGNATHYARFEKTYTVNFAAQTKQTNGDFATDTVGGNVSVAFITDVNGADASSEATANTGYQFLGWYDVNGNLLSSNTLYTTTITSAANEVTYYARFEAIPPATPTPTATAAPTPTATAAPTPTATSTPAPAPSATPTTAPAPMPVPTPAQTTETHSIPRTGDEFPLIPVIAAGLISAVGIVLMLRIRKQR